MLSIFTWQLAFVFPLVHPKEMEAGLVEEGFVTKVEVSSSDINSALGKSARDSLFENNSESSFSNNVMESVDSSHLATNPTTVFKAANALESNANSVFVSRMVKS